jgi:hypothetical protein
MTIHILMAGKQLCGKAVETTQDDPDRWVPMNLRHEATCEACLAASAPVLMIGDKPAPASAQAVIGELDADMRARELIERADRGEGRHDVKLVADYLRRHPTTIEAQPHQPPKLGEERRAALRDLFAVEGRTLMQLLFAWRAQGSISRWSTGPSKALALFVDHLQREWPSGCAAAGTKDLDFQPPEEREIEP